MNVDDAFPSKYSDRNSIFYTYLNKVKNKIKIKKNYALSCIFYRQITVMHIRLHFHTMFLIMYWKEIITEKSARTHPNFFPSVDY